MRTVQSASTQGDLKVTRNRKHCHQLMIGNGNITLLIEKEHELVEEAKTNSQDVVVISSTKRLGL